MFSPNTLPILCVICACLILLGIMRRCHDRRQPFGTERVVSEDVDCVFSTKEAAVLEDVGAFSLRALVPK